MKRLLVALALAGLAVTPTLAGAQVAETPFRQEADNPLPDHPMHPLHDLDDAFVALPLAAILGAALAFRPRRRGTPPRTPAVIQTQIILAIVGSVIMLVVGASVARAFAIVGAASLIRYRSKIEDPKDAGVMLCALAIGLATGVGLYALAIFCTLFMLAVVWIIESLEPPKQKSFELQVKTKDAVGLRPRLEEVLRRHQIGYELRTSSQDELSYMVNIPYDRRTDRISNAILRLDQTGETSVDWTEKSGKGK
jgi:uncharacterized membrane protein YhiD involved in acid resistance